MAQNSIIHASHRDIYSEQHYPEPLPHTQCGERVKTYETVMVSPAAFLALSKKKLLKGQLCERCHNVLLGNPGGGANGN